LTDFRNFPQAFQAIFQLVPRLHHDHFLPNPFQFIIHHS
jgi:hypothetical protein